jgi:hypothetical protein
MKKSSVNKLFEAPPKKTSTSANSRMVKTSSMNKSKRNSYKQYRGQGR